MELSKEELTRTRNLIQIGLRGMRREYRESVQYVSGLKEEYLEAIAATEALLDRFEEEVNV